MSEGQAGAEEAVEIAALIARTASSWRVSALELRMAPLLTHGHLGLGSLYARNGRPQEARAEPSAAIALFSAMGMTFWLHHAKAALAQPHA